MKKLEANFGTLQNESEEEPISERMFESVYLLSFPIRLALQLLLILGTSYILAIIGGGISV